MAKGTSSKSSVSKDPKVQALKNRYSKGAKAGESECARLRREAKQDREKARTIAAQDAERKKKADKRIKDTLAKKVAAAKKKLERKGVEIQTKYGCSPTAARAKTKGVRKAKKTEGALKTVEARLIAAVAKAGETVKKATKKAGKRGGRKQGKRSAKKTGKRGKRSASTDSGPSKAAIKRGTDKEHAEHPTIGRRMAKQVALDHLNQDPHFYD